MKKVVGTAAFIALLAGPAMGADLARPRPAPVVYRAPPPIVAAYSWTGCYWGVNGGGAWGESDVTYTQTGAYGIFPPADRAFSNALGSPRVEPSGWLVGGQLGCNLQAGMVVWGVETDINYARVHETVTAAGVLPVTGLAVASSAEVNSTWFYTLRGRVGLAADRALFYVTAGLAVARERFTQVFASPIGLDAGSVSDWQAGWTVGGGLEYAFTNALSAKIEYLYVDLDSVGFNSANSVVTAFTATHSADFRQHIVRAGLNWKFGGPLLGMFR